MTIVRGFADRVLFFVFPVLTPLEALVNTAP